MGLPKLLDPYLRERAVRARARPHAQSARGRTHSALICSSVSSACASTRGAAAPNEPARPWLRGRRSHHARARNASGAPGQLPGQLLRRGRVAVRACARARAPTRAARTARSLRPPHIRSLARRRAPPPRAAAARCRPAAACVQRAGQLMKGCPFKAPAAVTKVLYRRLQYEHAGPVTSGMRRAGHHRGRWSAMRLQLGAKGGDGRGRGQTGRARQARQRARCAAPRQAARRRPATRGV